MTLVKITNNIYNECGRAEKYQIQLYIQLHKKKGIYGHLTVEHHHLYFMTFFFKFNWRINQLNIKISATK